MGLMQEPPTCVCVEPRVRCSGAPSRGGAYRAVGGDLPLRSLTGEELRVDNDGGWEELRLSIEPLHNTETKGKQINGCT